MFSGQCTGLSISSRLIPMAVEVFGPCGRSYRSLEAQGNDHCDGGHLDGEGAHEHVAHPGECRLEGFRLQLLAAHLGSGAAQGNLGLTPASILDHCTPLIFISQLPC